MANKLWIVGLKSLLKSLEFVQNISRTHLRLFTLCIVLGIFCGISSCSQHSLRIVTFNIRFFGEEPKNELSLTSLVWWIQPDLLAVQEVKQLNAIDTLVHRMNWFGAKYKVIHTKCGGDKDLRLALIYNERKLDHVETKEFPELNPDGEGNCDGDRPGLLVTFETVVHKRISFLIVHLKANATAESAKRRRQQIAKIETIVKQLQQKEQDVVVMGDFNLVGFLDNKFQERTFIENHAQKIGAQISTREIGCSHYFIQQKTMTPGLLDHILVPKTLATSKANVHGYCRRLQCNSVPNVSNPPRDYLEVSDHCPVSVDLKLQ